MIGGSGSISGIEFIRNKHGVYVGNMGMISISLYPDRETKCVLTDTRDWSSWPFQTVHAAKMFAKRRKHRRTMEEHRRAESLKAERERLRMSLDSLAAKIGKSRRTIEAYFSGARVVPVGILKN